jgi:hypothetical protein
MSEFPDRKPKTIKVFRHPGRFTAHAVVPRP